MRMIEEIERQYGRSDIDYKTWYSDYARLLAVSKTYKELIELRTKENIKLELLTISHERSIKKTGSMSGNASNRAKSRNSVSGSSDTIFALNAAIEIYELFPEYTKEGYKPLLDNLTKDEKADYLIRILKDAAEISLNNIKSLKASEPEGIVIYDKWLSMLENVLEQVENETK